MRATESLLWSIALPGFGQLLNRKYIKGILFIILEFTINVQANFNVIIKHSFQGDIEQAINSCNYSWLMFYPCVYLFAAWDAFRDAGGRQSPYTFLPFVFAAYFVTVGLIFSDQPIFHILFGPVWLPILALIPGVLIGFIIRTILIRIHNSLD
ncbi:hypothetical protein [Tuberibacillus sp. Marseille-P3662]|uniref:hypothetical protein n=1 Tax=Tuberibacillus sp. Marseille-P3662 TaxID=1965358 RepID=UPI000A1CD9F2|nr:hypothetical protein [Tuberibacillus sp. Marseille-P3662]